MKALFTGVVVNTDKATLDEIRKNLQDRLDTWLGKGRTTVEVNQPEENKMEFTVHRKYGDFYKPDPLNNKYNIFAWDKQIMLGLDYQTNTQADFNSYTSRYMIYENIVPFENNYKKEARKKRASKVKDIEFEEYTDRFKFTVETE